MSGVLHPASTARLRIDRKRKCLLILCAYTQNGPDLRRRPSKMCQAVTLSPAGGAWLSSGDRNPVRWRRRIAAQQSVCAVGNERLHRLHSHVQTGQQKVQRRNGFGGRKTAATCAHKQGQQQQAQRPKGFSRIHKQRQEIRAQPPFWRRSLISSRTFVRYNIFIPTELGRSLGGRGALLDRLVMEHERRVSFFDLRALVEEAFIHKGLHPGADFHVLRRSH